MCSDGTKSLLGLIQSRAAAITVVGAGYVGLPLAVEFAREGFLVFAYDNNPGKIDSLLLGDSYVQDVPSEQLADLVASGRLIPTHDPSVMRRSDFISICVPTPLSKTKDPDLTFIRSAVHDLEPHLHAPMLITLESTTYPGTTDELLGEAVRNAGFQVGKDIFICFSPERVDPGSLTYSTRNTPKVVGGSDPYSRRIGAALYRCVTPDVHTVGSTATAEMVKLLENTFRSVNIALVNEMALMCERMGIDVWEVIRAASTKPFGYMPFYPGPGIGGHCIPLDPVYLSWKAKSFDFYSRFIELASDINGNMPYHVVDYLSRILNLSGHPLNGARVFCLGLTYKPDIDDLRESPALEVIRLLKAAGAAVAYNDPFVPNYSDGQTTMVSQEVSMANLRDADIVLVLTNHSSYNWELVRSAASVVVDTRGALTGPNVYSLGTPIPSPRPVLAYVQGGGK
jgi:UDP-N-acetyl-D-glucosamine dehydrogenase